MKAKYEKLMTLAVMLATVQVTGVANADLVAHWGMEGNTFESISSNHGVIAGNPSFVGGKVGTGAIKLNGDGDYVDCGNSPELNPDNITVIAWIKTSSIGLIESIVSKDRVDKRVWQFRKNGNGRLQFIVFKTNANLGEVIGSTIISDNKWHHVAGTWDGSLIKVYVDGQEDGSENYSGSLQQGQTNNVFIGRMETRNPCYFNGLIDEVAIFNHALSKDEIAWLYRSESVAFYGLFGAVLQDAEVILREQKPRRAIAFLEEKIGECEQQRNKDPNDICLTYEVPELYFLLAKAKEADGAPKKDIASTYKRALETYVLSISKQGSALLWLHENVSTKEYEDIVQVLIESNSGYLKGVATTAEIMVQEQKSKAAIGFLQDNLAAYEHWQEKHPLVNVAAEHELPRIYFQLAKAKESTGAPKKDIADEYSKTFNPSRYDYVSERTAALIWLLDNECTSEYPAVIKSFTQSRDVESCFRNVVGDVCKYFELKKSWAIFERFLDTLFTEAKYPYDWAIFVESCLSDKTSRWAKEYFDYLDRKPRLKFDRDCMVAEKYVAEEKFKEAAELYQDIVKRCGPEDDKGAFEFHFCKCLFDGGQYREAVPKLESFIANNKTTQRSLVKEAMLMKGRAHVQLGEIDKAIDSFFTTMIDYPETKEAPETNFFVGYCYMLEGKFELATEAFNCVIKGYPDSAYASKARICVTRIQSMTQ